MFLLNGVPLAVDTPFTDAKGNRYPANWLRLSTADEKAAIGITEVPDPTPFDQRFYWGYDAEGHLIPKDHAQLVEQWTAATRQTAGSLLAPTDWMVVRKVDNGTEIPLDWQLWRESVRTAAGTKNTAINATADTDALAAYITGADYPVWPVSPADFVPAEDEEAAE